MMAWEQSEASSLTAPQSSGILSLPRESDGVGIGVPNLRCGTVRAAHTGFFYGCVYDLTLG